MQKGLRVLAPAFLLLLLLGAGCANTTDQTDTAEDTGKGASPVVGVDICVRTDGDTAGEVRLSAANTTAGKENFSGWFTDNVVAKGNAGTEVCGTTPFAIAVGDKVLINGDWADTNGKRWLVESKGEKPAGSDDIKEIWIDDEYYAVGKECAYQSNGVKGFDVVCTVR
jgi:hypothetical protein